MELGIMMELGITQSADIHNTRSLIRALRYVLDILQTEEAFTVEEYKHTHTHTHARTRETSFSSPFFFNISKISANIKKPTKY